MFFYIFLYSFYFFQTIEKYVGRECDIVLLSLVRTTKIPISLESMPDVVSSLSRAKFGLYLFGVIESKSER